MTSSIDDTKPIQGAALTADVRSNFSHAEDEINSLLHMSEDSVTCTGTADAMTATFSIQPVLADTPRILVTAPASTSTVTTPSITVNDTLSSGAKTIVNKDGSALVVGDITSGIVMDLVYDGTNWVWMNGNDLQAALDTAKADIATLQAVANYPPNHLDGMAFTITTDVSSNDSFQVAVGTARTTTYDVDLTSALDKDITETWAEGDGNGGVNDTLFGSMAANTKYYVFAITQSDGSVDFIIDDNISGTGVLGDTAVTAAGYTELVHVGYVRTGDSATALSDVWRKSHPLAERHKLDSYTIESAQSKISFESIFTSDYRDYLVKLRGVHPETAGTYLCMRTGSSGGEDTSGMEYATEIHAGSDAFGFSSTLSAIFLHVGSSGGEEQSSEGGANLDITFYDPLNAGAMTQAKWSGAIRQNNGSTNHVDGVGTKESAAAVDSIHFIYRNSEDTTGYNVGGGLIEIYGLE